MKLSLSLLLFSLSFTASSIIEFNFGAQQDGLNWQVINDGVMGGLSTSQVDLTENSMKFYGTVSLENNGGFASVKTVYSRYDLSQAQKLTIKYKAEGQSMAITLENRRAFYEPYFKTILPETAGEWKTVEIELSSFKCYSLGRVLDMEISDAYLKGVQRIGLVTGDKKACAFKMEVDYLRFE